MAADSVTRRQKATDSPHVRGGRASGQTLDSRSHWFAHAWQAQTRRMALPHGSGSRPSAEGGDAATEKICAAPKANCTSPQTCNKQITFPNKRSSQMTYA